MGLGVPTFPDMLTVARSRGRDSDAPERWNGLVGCFPYAAGGGNTAYDLSGYGNDGTLTSSPTWTPTEYGQALTFSGSNQYVNYGNVTRLKPAAWTAICLVRSRLPAWGNLFNWTQAANSPAFRLGNSGATSLLFMGGSNYRYFDAITYAATDWLSLAVQCPGSAQADINNSKFWVNGADIGVTVDLATGAQSAKSAFEIGRGPNNDFTGDIAHFLLYDRFLTAAEIQQHYADPLGLLRLRRKVFAVRGGNRRRRFFLASGA